MEVFSSYQEISAEWAPLVLTIGKFDSVHLGHRLLLDLAKTKASEIKGYLCVLTFANHPAEVLKKGVSVQKLCTRAHQLKLFSESGVDGVVLLEFTQQFGQQTAKQFIESLYAQRPFKSLVLGYDASLGCDRQGNTLAMHELAEKIGFELQYSHPCTSEGLIISSSLIRNAIKKGDLATVEKMLGRKYSILTYIAEESGNKITLDIGENLCLPPPGVYPVEVLYQESKFFGHAVIKNEPPLVTLKFEEKNCELGKGVIEVVFPVD